MSLIRLISGPEVNPLPAEITVMDYLILREIHSVGDVSHNEMCDDISSRLGQVLVSKLEALCQRGFLQTSEITGKLFCTAKGCQAIHETRFVLGFYQL